MLYVAKLMRRFSHTLPTLPPHLFLPALFTLLGVLVPVCYLVMRALNAELGELQQIVFRSHNLQLALNTLLLTTTTLLGSSLVAFPLAFAAARSNFQARWLLLLLGTAPLALPSYVGAYTLMAASGQGGAIQQLLGLIVPLPSGFWGASLVLTAFTFPYLFLNLYNALKTQDPALEETARLLGRNSWQIFLGVTLPQLRPAWLAGALLIALHAIADFGVTSLMRYPTFSAAIYQQYTAAYDRVYAAWLSLFVIAFALLLLWLEARLMRGLFLARVSPSCARQAQVIQLGRYRWFGWLIWLLAAAIAMVTLIVPIVAIVHWLGLADMAVLTQAGLDNSSNWQTHSWQWSDVWQSLLSSASIAIVSALTTTTLAVALAYIGNRFSMRWAVVTERVAYLGYATPPLAFGLALIFFTLGTIPALYQTFTLLVIAYSLHFSAEAIGPIRSGLMSAKKSLEEVASVLGHSAISRLGKVIMPLLRSSLLTSLAFVFLSVIKELPLTLLLAPVGFEPLARNLWTYTEEAQYSHAAPYALALLICGIVSTLLIRRNK